MRRATARISLTQTPARNNGTEMSFPFKRRTQAVDDKPFDNDGFPGERVDHRPVRIPAVFLAMVPRGIHTVILALKMY